MGNGFGSLYDNSGLTPVLFLLFYVFEYKIVDVDGVRAAPFLGVGIPFAPSTSGGEYDTALPYP